MVHKAMAEARNENIKKQKEEAVRLFEACIVPVLIGWAESSHATMDVKEETEQIYVVTLTSAYGFTLKREKWLRGVLVVADCISSEVFSDSVLIDLVFDLNETVLDKIATLKLNHGKKR